MAQDPTERSDSRRRSSSSSSQRPNWDKTKERRTAYVNSDPPPAKRRAGGFRKAPKIQFRNSPNRRKNRSLQGGHPATGKFTDFLLLQPNGERPTYHRLRNALVRATMHLRLKEDDAPQKFRHSFVTEMLRNGMSLAGQPKGARCLGRGRGRERRRS